MGGKYKKVYEDIAIMENKYGEKLMIVNNERLCVPKGLIEKVIKVHHRSHTSPEPLIETIKKCYYWPEMTMHITHFCEQCEGFRRYRPALRLQKRWSISEVTCSI